ncbi:hypothetical protein ACFQJ8_24025 [Halocatena marina]|uniref:hypothetical protein n=1 Tax=Halocatena marina TaxID=2934937 RepID=UPI00361E4C37
MTADRFTVDSESKAGGRWISAPHPCGEQRFFVRITVECHFEFAPFSRDGTGRGLEGPFDDRGLCGGDAIPSELASPK